jgi:hypothetical protein
MCSLIGNYQKILLWEHGVWILDHSSVKLATKLFITRRNQKLFISLKSINNINITKSNSKSRFYVVCDFQFVCQ